MIELAGEGGGNKKRGRKKKTPVPTEIVKYKLLPKKIREQFYAVAEVAAAKILKEKGLYNSLYDMRSLHLYDYSFRVKFFDGHKLKHNVLVKMNQDFKVLERTLDH